MRIEPSGPAAYASVRPSGASAGSTSSPVSSVSFRVAPNTGSSGADLHDRMATTPNAVAPSTAATIQPFRTPRRGATDAVAGGCTNTGGATGAAGGTTTTGVTTGGGGTATAGAAATGSGTATGGGSAPTAATTGSAALTVGRSTALTPSGVGIGAASIARMRSANAITS